MSGRPGTSALARLPDGALAARCRSGDEEAWAEFVTRFSRYVYAIAVQAFRLDERAAEDVFQETFARAYERLDHLRDDEAVRAWLGSLARRLCLDHLRRGSREGVTDVGLIEPADLDDSFARLDEALAVRDALGTLPEHCQEVLDRFFCRDESYERIGRELEISLGTVASRISRCLGRLREVFEGRR
jgi:RNA polymerase sigma-70 factor (ECF subfamily)